MEVHGGGGGYMGRGVHGEGVCMHCLPKAGWPEREVPEAVGSRKTDDTDNSRSIHTAYDILK